MMSEQSNHPRLAWLGRPAPGAPAADAVPDPRVLEVHPAAGPPLLVPPAGRAEEPPNRLFLGDNLALGRALLPELGGTVDLLYMDPPFGTGGRFLVRRQPGEAGRAAYSDAWSGGLRGYLEMLQPRLELAHALLAAQGSLYVHVDPTASHYVKVLLDEIFGPECFQREIVWRIGWVSGYKGTVRNWVRNHDAILFYTRDPERFTFHKRYVPHPPGYSRRGGGEGPGHPIDDVWNGSPAEHALGGAESLDSIQIKSFSAEKTGYETQKNESLLRRVIEASSDPGGLVADLFAGSGTTAAVAEKLGRRWLAWDVSPAAVQVARARLLALPARAGFAVVGAGEALGDADPDVSIEVEGHQVWLAVRDPERVDYWAVQWEAPDGAGGGWVPLRPDLVAFRSYATRGERPLQACAAHRYPGPGGRWVAVHVADAKGELRRCVRRVEVA